jgi:mono/diheme cytochrome c family protein
MSAVCERAVNKSAMSKPAGKPPVSKPAVREFAVRKIAAVSAAAAASAALSLLGAAAVSADPASSAQSAWSALPALPASALPKLEDPLAERGREVFQERCAACHGPIPKDTIGPPYLPLMPGTRALQARYKGVRPAELEQRTDLTSELVNAIVRGGLNSMPFFRPTELSDDDLAALDAYLTRKAR